MRQAVQQTGAGEIVVAEQLFLSLVYEPGRMRERRPLGIVSGLSGAGEDARVFHHSHLVALNLADHISKDITPLG